MAEDLDARVADATPQNSNEGGAQNNDHAVVKPIESSQAKGCSLARHAESRSRTPGVAAIVVALGFVFAFRRAGKQAFRAEKRKQQTSQRPGLAGTSS